ncbi:MAG: site-specific DNA-methyltransferase [Victivallaceae bacterium]|nr:site-specific DNA-methyltransferase [Victivallaceae bacterium]
MDKLEGMSMDIVQDNIDKLKMIFPDVFTEDKVDFDALKEVLGNYTEDREEYYNFSWNGKAQVRRLAQTPSTGTLRPCKEESKDWDTTENLFIEGDNLEVLKLLQKSYHGKVKMIYIDPPYNTGKDFVYPDNFKDNINNYLELTGQTDEEGKKLTANAETAGRYHTNWLNMMYPRLRLARNLLKDDGVIFISIDDNEVNNLRKVCDEVFGEENLVGSVCWKNKYGAGAKTKGFIEVHEYILCYSKTELENIESILSNEQIKAYDKNKDHNYHVRGGYVTQPLMTNSLDDRENLQYSISYKDDVIYPRKQWVWGKERLMKAINHDEVVFKKKKNGEYSVRAKVYLKDENGLLRQGKPLSLLNGPFNQEGTKETAQLIGENLFSFPKPTSLIQFFLGFTINNKKTNDDIILDFFSGSCTTAHATMSLNADDNGNRKFIMVQLPEPCDEKSEAFKAGYKTIAEIGKERIRRAGDKIQEELKAKEREPDLLSSVEEAPAKLDIGFKVFKLDTSNIKTWDADYDDLENALFDHVENLKEDRGELDVLFEILLKYGLDLTVPIEERKVSGDKTLYIVGAGALVVCLDDNVDIDVVETIAKVKAELKPEVMRVVFKDSGFDDDVVKTNAVQILRQHNISDVKSI